ncbi:phosphatidate cytidylyltransferase [bacterium]|nr:phosphatidate cytidylyltransferase [bacterium]
MLKRSLTGLLLVGITVAAIYAGGIYVLILLGIIMNFSLYEWSGLMWRTQERKTMRWGLFVSSNLLYAATMTLLYARIGCVDGGTAMFPGLMWILALVGMVICSLFKEKEDINRRSVSLILGGSLYVGGSLALLNFLAAPFHADGGHVLMGFFLLVWMNDVFAYLIGSAWGRHKLCERLSPSKTWEGAVGGVLCAMTGGILWGMFMLPHVNPILWISVSAITPIAAILGDLWESKLKREEGVKDSGHLLPGHGGFLDRYDSVFIAAPVVVAWWQLFLMIMG